MNILVWQWGRRGAGPRFAACLTEALRGRAGTTVALSLPRDAEILAGAAAPTCELPVRTYRGFGSFLVRLATAPLALAPLLWRLRPHAPDLAICAMPSPLDLLMVGALKLLGSRIVVIVHDASAHPGDGYPGQMRLQRLLCRAADALVTLSGHVGRQLRQQGLARAAQPVIGFRHPPFGFEVPATERAAGPPRLLCFGRLLPYKGLDLLAAAATLLPPATPIDIRVVGRGPESPVLRRLRACSNVSVENRWVPEAEVGALLSWCDAVILPYREASQSGVAAAALAAARPVIATNVGGLREQVATFPQAILCDPDPADLARAIRLWLASPLATAPPPDARAAWRLAASDLMAGLDGALPPRIGSRRKADFLRWRFVRKPEA